MNLKEQKQKLVSEFNQLQQTVQQIEIRKQRILGQLELLEELEKEKSKNNGDK